MSVKYRTSKRKIRVDQQASTNILGLAVLVCFLAGVCMVILGPLSKGFILLGTSFIMLGIGGNGLFELPGVKVIGSAGFVFAAIGLIMEAWPSI